MLDHLVSAPGSLWALEWNTNSYLVEGDGDSVHRLFELYGDSPRHAETNESALITPLDGIRTPGYDFAMWWRPDQQLAVIGCPRIVYGLCVCGAELIDFVERNATIIEPGMLPPSGATWWLERVEH